MFIHHTDIAHHELHVPCHVNRAIFFIVILPFAGCLAITYRFQLEYTLSAYKSTRLSVSKLLKAEKYVKALFPYPPTPDPPSFFQIENPATRHSIDVEVFFRIFKYSADVYVC